MTFCRRNESGRLSVSGYEAVRGLSKRIGIPRKLKEIGVQKDDLAKLAHSAFHDVCTPGNPRDVGERDLLDIYQRAYQ